MDSPLPTPRPAAPFVPCCSEGEVTALVHRFYARARTDDLLGPVFAAAVHDWPAHLSQLVDFWSALLRGTHRFDGAPLPRHLALPLSEALFERWLALFRQTTAELGNPTMQARADARAAAIAEHFWRHYRQRNTPAG